MTNEKVPERHKYIPTQLHENSPCAWANHPDSIGDARYYCGLPPSAAIHLSDDVAGDKFIPFTETTKPQSTTEHPDRIRLVKRGGAFDGHWYYSDAAIMPYESEVEYARVDRKYFCSCGGALTAEEYITHYFDLGHDRGDPAVPASVAPVVDNNDLISRAGAKAAMCNMCANPDRYKPAEPLEGSMRLFHFQRSDNWNAGQCLAQAIDSVPAAAPVEQKQPLPDHYLCVAPDEQPRVINFLRGYGTDADKELAQLHLNLCLRCQELANAAPAEQSDSLLTQIATITDLGSAEEFGDALERLQSVRKLIDNDEGAR